MKKLGLFILFFIFSQALLADDFPSKSSTEFWNNFDDFFLNLKWLKQILLSPTTDLYLHIKYLVGAFSTILIVRFLITYLFDDITVIDLLVLIFSIFATTIYLNNYADITSYGWTYATGIVVSIHTATIGSHYRGGINSFLLVLFDNIEITSNTSNIFLMAGRAFVFAILHLLLALFAFGSTLATIWALWGYAITSIWGIVVIPFVILRETRFLFMAWLKVYIGYLIYYVIANLNLVVVYLLVISMFKLPVNIAASPTMSIPIYEINVDEGFPLALVTMLLIGIMSMISIGSLASSLAGGGLSISSGIGAKALRKFT